MSDPIARIADELERRHARAMCPYKIMQGRRHSGCFVVFKSELELMEYERENDHFDDCPVADFDGYRNAFYIKQIH